MNETTEKTSEDSAQETITWQLEGSADSGERIVVRPLPFLVGRLADCHFQIESGAVSSHHGELFTRDGWLWLRDLGSTNGTFLNGKPVFSACRLHDGDLIHFADQRFRLTAERRTATQPTTRRLSRSNPSLAPRAVRETVGFLDLLRSHAVTSVYQPVLRLEDQCVMGFEALGRGAHPDAPTGPEELFRIGKGLGMSAELSRALRRRVLQECPGLPYPPGCDRRILFLNTHPAEIPEAKELLASLREFIAREPGIHLIVELHEDSAIDLDAFKAFRAQLRSVGVGQAFDDFGKGEERLQELCELAPDYVKFDRVFAHDLHAASPGRREMVASLVAMMKRIGVTTVIEGVETAEEAAACRAIGFDLAQGYFFGRPTPLALLDTSGL